MPAVEARRTLVKSPPELWAELSDQESLARRLEPFGEIRITRREPETTVAWEGERARGTVLIEPSGWGTRVTLTAEASEPEPPAEPEPEPDPPAEPEPEPDPPAEPEPLPETIAAPGHGGLVGAVFPLRPGFPPSPRLWSRLMPWRSRAAAQETAPGPVRPHPVPPPAEPAPEERPQPAPPEPATIPAPRPPLEPAAGEIDASPSASPPPSELDTVLAGVLDDLGSAHHRPFSRG